MEALIRYAGIEDVTRLEMFLDKAKLSSDGLNQAVEYFLIMENSFGEIIGTLGIEPLGKIGLLRSFVVTTDATEKDLFILFEQILSLAKERELETLYLATNKKSSLELFQLIGFTEEEMISLPEALYDSEHVKHILTVDNFFFLKLFI